LEIVQIKYSNINPSITWKELAQNYLGFWNLVDVMRMTSQLSYLILSSQKNRINEAQASLGLIMLFSWVSLMNYLRVFAGFRYYVYLILQCIVDLKDFFVLYLIMLMGFSSANYFSTVGLMESEAADNEGDDTIAWCTASGDNITCKESEFETEPVAFIGQLKNEFWTGFGDFGVINDATSDKSGL